MGLKIDGICASSAIDTSSEAIDIENLDISSLKSGQGVLNYEHKNPKAAGASFLDILGAITFAKKIMCAEDCDSDRQTKYWEQIQLPFVYIQAELFDSEDHPGAVCAAAIIRFYHSRGMPILVRFSIDGHTIEREGNVLKRCIARDVALTIKPANHSCVSGVLDEKAKADGALDELSRSEDGLVRLPGVQFSMLAPEVEVEPMDLIRSEVANLQDMAKAMTAGGGAGVAPGNLSQGAALGKEDVQGGLKMRLTSAFRDWNRRGGKTLEEHLAKTLPDVHEDFLKKFVELITEARLRKASELHEFLIKALAGEGPPKPMAKQPTAVEGRGRPKPVMNDDELHPSQMSAADTAAADKDIQATRVSIQANNPGASTHGMKPVAAMPPVPPHVPGLRVGVHPDEAMDKDIEAIRASIRGNQPQAADIQGGARAFEAANPGQPTVAPMHGLMVGQAPGGTQVLPQPSGNTAVTKVVKAEGDTDFDFGANVPAGKRPKKEYGPATIRGKVIEPNADVRVPHFDEDAGIYHLPFGSFPMSIPKRQGKASRGEFKRLLEDPKASEAHDYAMGHWMRLNQALRDGNLPPAVIMHAVLFSMLSANKGVPQQELMYAHAADQMKESGIDAMDPRFGAKENMDAWRRRDKPNKGPDTAKEYFENHPGVHVSAEETDTGRRQGEFVPFSFHGQKPGEQGYSMSRYHESHDLMRNLVDKYRTDGRAATRALMLDKVRGGGVIGIKQKTGRYAFGMMGAGNTVVPDTHWIRHAFGLDVDKDSDTIWRLKQALWAPSAQNSSNLEAIDRYYFRNHDAVEHMLNHPKHGKFFRDNPEQAIFPAFWKHWFSIVPHERFRGLSVPKESASNEMTTHQPFWEAVTPFLKGEEHEVDPQAPATAVDPQMALAARTAVLHRQWVDKYGETQAMVMYLSHLLPHLMAEGLAKAEPSEWTHKEMPSKPAGVVKFRGQQVVPGEIRYRSDLGHHMAGATLKLVGSEPTHHVALMGSGPSHKVIRVSRELEGKAYDVTRPAVTTNIPHTISTEHLHEASRSPEQLALAARLDFNHPRRFIPGDNSTHAERGQAPWTQGKPKVFVKPSANYIGRDYVMKPDAGIREASYYNAARDVFGLGHLVPPTIAFWHPHDGRLHSASEFVHGGQPISAEDNMRWHQEGQAPRMALMDYILGNNDRWAGNVMTAPDGSPRLIDHGFAFQYKGGQQLPAYVHPSVRHQPFAPDVHQWVQRLNPEALRTALINGSIHGTDVSQATQRLLELQQKVAAGERLGYNHVRK